MTFENDLWYESEVGDVSPVSQKKGLFFWYARALFYLVYPFALTAGAIDLAEDGWSPFVVTMQLLMFLGSIWIIGFSYKRIRTGHDEKIYFMAGPSGLAWSEPHISFKGYSVSNQSLSWSEVQSWTVYTERFNGIKSEDKIKFVLLNGQKVEIDLYPYKCKANEAADKVENLFKAN